MEQMAFGCAFCRSGRERAFADLMEIHFPEVEFFVPSKIRIRRSARGCDEEKVVLFPGYVFFRAPEDFNIARFHLTGDLYYVLYAEKLDWRLRGSDYALAKTFYESNGVIDLSQAWYEGDRIRIVDGFLKNYEGCITRVNHRAHTAEITLNLMGRKNRVWLGFELIEKEEADKTPIKEKTNA